QADLWAAGEDRRGTDDPGHPRERRRSGLHHRGGRRRWRARDLSPRRRRGERPVRGPYLGRLAGGPGAGGPQEGRQGDRFGAFGNAHADHQGGQIATTTGAIKGIDPETIDSRTTLGVFFRQAEKYRDRALVHHRVGEEWQVESWEAMRRDVLAVASGLIEAGVQP